MVDKYLEDMLRQRHIPAARSNLAERIIAAAVPRPAKAGFDFGKWTQEFFESFALPQPALALGMALIIGLYLGASIDANAHEPVAENLAAYLDMNDDGE